jgi:DNA-binding MarR family transcriptional regulator
MKSDYLKYWRVVRFYYTKKYKLRIEELELLLFLYSEQYFTKDKLREFNSICSWDKRRVDKMLEQGWIQIFRPNTNRRKRLYKLSVKAKQLVTSLYKRLEGDEIPTGPNNQFFRKKVSYADHMYKNMILKMNEYVKTKDDANDW